MSDAENDPVLRRAIDELRQLPVVEPDAVQRVVGAAAAARLAPAEDEPMLPRRRARLPGVWMLAGVAAAAAFAGFMLRDAWSIGANKRAAVTVASTATAVQTPVAAGAPATLRAVGDAAAEALPIPQQFVLHNGSAHRVAVVGDFNRWNPQSAVMERSANSDEWSVTIPILPGRHMYGFMVDDTMFVLNPDPRVARARDADLGVDGSVVIVGRP
jgi:hypothetical protein